MINCGDNPGNTRWKYCILKDFQCKKPAAQDSCFPFFVQSVTAGLVLGRMQHIQHHDSTFALLKECKVHVLEIGSVGQTVY